MHQVACMKNQQLYRIPDS